MEGPMSDMEFYIICGVLAYLVLSVVLRPILRIWSINSLFRTKIKQNPNNWTASTYLLDEIKNILDRK